jgi:hypothetical protein
MSLYSHVSHPPRNSQFFCDNFEVVRYELHSLYMQIQTFELFHRGYVLKFEALKFSQKYSCIKWSFSTNLAQNHVN